VRLRLAVLALCALAAGCSRPGSSSEANLSASSGLSARSPYTGRWASGAKACSDEKSIWTIEPHRMGIRPELRFCAFKSIYISQADDSADAVWSADANCLANGRQSKEFVFFRVKRSLRQMRVTFNDNPPIDLVRCLDTSS
jgi:hypothetical protein